MPHDATIPTSPTSGADDAQLRAHLTNRYHALMLMLLGVDTLVQHLYDRLRMLAEQDGCSHELAALAIIAQQIRETHHQIGEHAAAWHALKSAAVRDHVEATPLSVTLTP